MTSGMLLVLLVTWVFFLSHASRISAVTTTPQPKQPSQSSFRTVVDPVAPHLEQLNRLFRRLDLPLSAVQHRNAPSLVGSGQGLVQSLRDEMLTHGSNLHMLSLSQRLFPPSDRILAFPLRHPHGQGGPGTTIVVLQNPWWNNDMKIIGFGHIAGIHPDDFATLMESIKQTGDKNVRTLKEVLSGVKNTQETLRLIL